MKFAVLLLIAVNFTCFPYVSAQAVNNQQYYQTLLSQGHGFYRDNNYSLALKSYQKSYQIVPLDSTLNNIAICHFKLQQWPQALSAFEILNENQQGVPLLAYYIAVIHKKLGNTEVAISLFYDLLQNSDDDSVAVMAGKQLNVLSNISEVSSKNAVTDNQSSWQGMLDFQAGYDSNVSLPYDDEQQIPRGIGDQYVNILANTSWLSRNDFKNAWLVDLTLFNSTYHEASDYDVRFISLSARKFFTPEKWQNTKIYVGVNYDSINLAGEDYLNNSAMTFGTSYQLTKQQRILAEFTLKNISEGSNDYSYLAGNSHKLKLTWRQASNNGYWKVGIITEQDKRDDKYVYLTTEDGELTNEIDDFTNYSTDRFSLFTSRFWYYKNWEVNASAKYRYSSYDAQNIIDGESVGFREDKLLLMILGGAYNINDDFSLSTEIEWSNNESNMNLYDYAQYTFSIGTTWLF